MKKESPTTATVEGVLSSKPVSSSEENIEERLSPFEEGGSEESLAKGRSEQEERRRGRAVKKSPWGIFMIVFLFARAQEVFHDGLPGHDADEGPLVVDDRDVVLAGNRRIKGRRLAFDGYRDDAPRREDVA